MKRAVLLTYGSRGDVEPFVALGLALRAAGYSARLAAPAGFEWLALRHGLEFWGLPGEPDQLALSLVDTAGTSWTRMVLRMVQHVLPIAAAVFRNVLEAARDADVLVHSFLMTDAGHTTARALGVPDLSAQLFPVFASTSAFGAPAFPEWPLGPVYRRASHALTTIIFRDGGRLLYRRVRALDPGLPSIGPWPFARSKSQGTPLLFAFSPLVIPRPSDWPGNAHVTGYWPLEAAPGWTPPLDLLRFLERDPAPVYIGFGSMRTRRMQDLARTCVEAVLQSGQRALLAFPEALLQGLDLGERIQTVADVPHAWLLPRTRMVVHHGGAGTTGSALRAGVPSAAVPFTADQAFWARRIHRLGVGPPPAPPARLTARRLASMIEEGLAGPGYATRAAEIGRAIRAEPGLAEAVRIIGEHCPA